MSARLVLACLLLLSSSVTVCAGDDPAVCGEHGVLEAVCTRCNPRLAAVFQAKGDWCRAHGFPESFCPTCKPARTGRPDADVSDESTRVRFAGNDIAPAIGLATAHPRKDAVRPIVNAPVRIEHDPGRTASVNPRAGGVVRRLHVNIGSTVKAGDPLVTIESAAVSADRSRLEAARKRAAVAGAAVTRQRRLVSSGVLAIKDLQASEQELSAANAEVEALSASTVLVGGTSARTYDLTAPIAGTVVQQSVTAGQLVDTEHAVIQIVDTSTVWGVIDLPESDVARVAVGQLASVTLDVLPGRTWRGKIAYLAPDVDPKTRTVAARVRLENAQGALRANMLGVATVEVGALRPVILVPRTALQRVHDRWMVFEKLAADRFEGKTVEVESSDADPVAVLEGLDGANEVVTAGSFLLKTEVLKESIGAGCCEADARK